jgi:hypothetical protein
MGARKEKREIDAGSRRVATARRGVEVAAARTEETGTGRYNRSNYRGINPENEE